MPNNNLIYTVNSFRVVRSSVFYLMLMELPRYHLRFEKWGHGYRTCKYGSDRSNAIYFGKICMHFAPTRIHH